MKKLNLLLVVLLIAVFAIFALGSTESTTTDQGSGSVSDQSQSAEVGEDSKEPAAPEATKPNDQLGEYSLVIDSCRLAKSYDDKPVVIVKYIFGNVSDDDAACFSFTMEDAVYQNGVGLNEAWILDDSANYSMDNQTKEIKKGATIEVEVAYELNDTTTDIEVEVSELISFNDSVITKTFSIA